MKQKRASCYSTLFIDSSLLLMIFVLDQFSKKMAIEILQNSYSIEVFRWGGIEGYLTFATNSGAAWGMFQDMTLVLSIIRTLFLIALFFVYLQGIFSRIVQIGLVLIMSGAFSNLLDTALYGHVIDMVHIRFWGYDYPIFNIADSSITLGAVICMLSSYKQHFSSTK